MPSTGVSTGAVTSVSSGVEGATGVSTGGTKHISGNAGKFELGASVRSKTKTENTTSGDDSSDSSISSKKSTGMSSSIQKSLKRLIKLQEQADERHERYQRELKASVVDQKSQLKSAVDGSISTFRTENEAKFQEILRKTEKIRGVTDTAAAEVRSLKEQVQTDLGEHQSAIKGEMEQLETSLTSEYTRVRETVNTHKVTVEERMNRVEQISTQVSQDMEPVLRFQGGLEQRDITPQSLIECQDKSKIVFR